MNQEISERTTLAPCLSASCTVETNIDRLPEETLEKTDLQQYPVRSRRLELIDRSQRTWYINNPPSAMVDATPESAFRSFEGRLGYSN